MSEELAWAAGFYDGEGSCGAYPKHGRGYRYLRVSVNQVERQPLDRFAASVGVGKVYGPYKRKRCAQWNFQVTGSAARVLLDALWPWLSEPKRRQAAEAFALLDLEAPRVLGEQNQPCEPGCTCRKHSSWMRRERKVPPSAEHRRGLARVRTQQYRERQKAAAVA